MNYFSVDIGSKNKDHPKRTQWDTLRKHSVTWTHAYGMSFSSEPDEHLDYCFYCRTTMAQEELRALLERLRFPYATIAAIDPDHQALRHLTVRQELDLDDAATARAST